MVATKSPLLRETFGSKVKKQNNYTMKWVITMTYDKTKDLSLLRKLSEYAYYGVNIARIDLGDEHSLILGDIEESLLNLLSIGYVVFCLLELIVSHFGWLVVKVFILNLERLS
jgi:hypothetical protein